MNNANQPLKVLRIIARLNVGGPAKHVAWLMGGMDPERFQQTLAAGRVPEFEDDMGPWLKGQGIGFSMLPRLGRAISPLNDAICLFQVLGLMARTRPHIVATHTSKAGFLGRAALMLYRPWARLRGWPRPKAVHTFHGHTFHGYFGALVSRVFLFLERFLAKRATWRIVTISPRQFEEIHHTFKVGRESQFKVVPLGIDLSPFVETRAGRRDFRAELGAADDEILIGAVGRVAPVKNYSLFLETAAGLRDERPELFARCRFLLIGGGAEEEMAALREQARELKLGEKMLFLGNRSDPGRFFPGLDLLLLTSVNEGTPVAILEGGACGLPVLATRVGGVPDILGPDQKDQPQPGLTFCQRGLTASSEDGEALARGLAWLVENAPERERLGLALKDYVRANHSKERLVKDISELYSAYDQDS